VPQRVSAGDEVSAASLKRSSGSFVISGDPLFAACIALCETVYRCRIRVMSTLDPGNQAPILGDMHMVVCE